MAAITKEEKKENDEIKRKFKDKWPDTRPHSECYHGTFKGQQPGLKCKSIAARIGGSEYCSISLSPGYWWATRECCPRKVG